MPAGRRFAGVLLVLGLASLGVLVSYGATWVVALVPVFTGSATDAAPAREVTLAGRDLAPLGGAMGWVGLAAIAALLATRTWGRRVTGAVVLLAGGAAGASAVAFGLTEAATGGGGTFVAAALGDAAEADSTSVSITAWWLLAVLSGLAMLVCGLLALLDGPAWPRLGARYSRSESATRAPSAAAAWDALDRGEDPSIVDEPRDSAGTIPGSMGSAPPDTRSEEER
jgi:uncharacterized membrane protein (TIGR02234 family)